MSKLLERIRISYRQHSATGLLCAYSDDLSGLLVFARTPAQLYEKTPRACEDLVEVMSGERPCYRWTVDDVPEEDTFILPSPSLGELIPCH